MPSYVVARAVQVGDVAVDVAFGGAIYAFAPASQWGLRVVPEDLPRLIEVGREVKRALDGTAVARHPDDDRLSGIYGTVLHEDLGPRHQRNVAIFADGEVDRSPTGSATSARTALLLDAGAIAADDTWRNDSIVATTFYARALGGVPGGLLTEVEGTAFRTGEHRFLLRPARPSRDRLRDPMTLRFVDAAEVERRLGGTVAVDALEAALRAGLDPEADPPRGLLALDRGELLVMPSAAGGRPVVKLVTVGGSPRVQGVCVVFDGETLAPVALVDGIAVTNVRTAAVSALAVRHLAVPEARRLLVFGRGPQAHAHVAAMRAVRPIEHVDLVGRDAGDVAALVSAADVICCCTTAREPLFDGALAADHATVVAIGSHERGRARDRRRARRARHDRRRVARLGAARGRRRDPRHRERRRIRGPARHARRARARRTPRSRPAAVQEHRHVVGGRGGGRRGGMKTGSTCPMGHGHGSAARLGWRKSWPATETGTDLAMSELDALRAEFKALLASWEYAFAMGHGCSIGDHPELRSIRQRAEYLRARIAEHSP